MSWIGWTAVAVVIGNLTFFGALYLWMLFDDWLDRRRREK